MTNYIITIGVFILLMILFKVAMFYMEKGDKIKNTAKKVFNTQYGNLYINDHERGIEVRNEHGKRAIIESMKAEDINEALAQNIVMCYF